MLDQIRCGMCAGSREATYSCSSALHIPPQYLTRLVAAMAVAWQWRKKKVEENLADPFLLSACSICRSTRSCRSFLLFIVCYFCDFPGL